MAVSKITQYWDFLYKKNNVFWFQTISKIITIVSISIECMSKHMFVVAFVCTYILLVCTVVFVCWFLWYMHTRTRPYHLKATSLYTHSLCYRWSVFCTKYQNKQHWNYSIKNILRSTYTSEYSYLYGFIWIMIKKKDSQNAVNTAVVIVKVVDVETTTNVESEKSVKWTELIRTKWLQLMHLAHIWLSIVSCVT